MVVADSPEWLPPGFTVKTKYRSGKKVKYYLNVATGKKYNSKNEVIRCAKENNNILLVTPQNADGSGPSSVTKVDAISEKTNDSAWLPNGWTVEEKSRKSGSTAGLSYKIYTESSTGRKFYSKASVTRYLDNVDHTDIMTKQNKYYPNVATCMKYNSKNEVIHCAEENNNILLVTPQTKNADDNGTSSVTKVDVISEKTNDYAWLPSGWTVEERRRKRGSTEGLSYKIYTESSTGRKFYSKASITRYLDNIAHTDIMTKQNKINKEGEPLPDTSLQISPVRDTESKGISVNKRKADSLTMIDNVDENVPKQSPQIQSVTNTDAGHEDTRKGNSLVKIDNVGEPFPEMSPQVVSMTNNDGIREKKRRISSFVTVAVEWSTDKDLPDGWIKEIRTSKSGDRIRKDPFYTDPVSGYMFRSKPDALRYLETNDIGSCACKPRKRELDDIKSIENINLSSTPAKLKTQPFLGEGSNGGAESSGTKVPAELDTNTLEREHVNQENSIKSAEIGNKLEPENDVSKKDVRVMAVDAATSSPVADPSTNQQLPESGRRIKTGSRKPKKRRESSSTPTRTSKRLAGSEPEMKINFDLNKPSLRAALRGSTAKVVDASLIVAPLKASDISQSSIIEPAKEAVEQVVIGMETCQGANRPKEVEKHTPTEGSTIPAEQPGATGTAGTNPFVDGQQSQVSPLCYDFGDSWTNPLEFALKTLTGEFPIEDTVTFPSCFREPFDATFKEADVWLKQSSFDAPVNFQSEFPSHSESSKKQNAVDPSSVSFSGLGFSSCGGFNFQPSTEVGKKDSQTKFNP